MNIKRTFVRAFNALLVFLVARVGLNFQGAEVLSVRGRKSGNVHSLPVNPLSLNGDIYLVSPRGETQWVRNLRVTGSGELRRGRSIRPFHVRHELPVDERIPVLRAYLAKWHWQVATLIDVSKPPSDDELRRIAPDHPVFALDIDGQ